MCENKITSSLSLLPLELVEIVTGHLPNGDLSNLMETSKTLRSASLNVWSRRANSSQITLRPNKAKIEAEGIQEMLKIPRYAAVRKLDMSRMNMNLKSWEDLFSCIPKSNIEVLNIGKNKLTKVSAPLLAKAISSVRVANLDGTFLCPGQAMHVLKASIQSNTLEELNLRYNDLSDVPESILARSMSRLKSVNLAYTELRNEQITEMLEGCLQSTSLESLNLCENDLMDVSPKLLAQTIGKLQAVNLDAACLVTEQIVEILQTSLNSKTLENLNIRFNDLSNIPSPILAQAVSSIKNVNVSFSDLSAQQVEAILTKSLDSKILQNLELSGVELNEIPATLLAKAVSRLKIANLGFTDLKTYQITEILSAGLKSKTIKMIDLGGIDFDDVSTSLVDEAEHFIFHSNFLCVMIRERSQILSIC